MTHAIADAGFDCRWCVIQAKHVGAPMQRARVFVLCCKRGAVEDLATLRRTVPQPAQLKFWEKQVRSAWNASAPCPPVKQWLLKQKPKDHTQRLCMMGNAVPSWHQFMGAAAVLVARQHLRVKTWLFKLSKPGRAGDVGVRLSPPCPC